MASMYHLIFLDAVLNTHSVVLQDLFLQLCVENLYFYNVITIIRHLEENI